MLIKTLGGEGRFSSIRALTPHISIGAPPSSIRPNEGR